MFKFCITIAAMALISGCGFEPLHGRQQSSVDGSSALRQIAVPPIPERLGQLLRLEFVLYMQDAYLDKLKNNYLPRIAQVLADTHRVQSESLRLLSASTCAIRGR